MNTQNQLIIKCSVVLNGLVESKKNKTREEKRAHNTTQLTSSCLALCASNLEFSLFCSAS